MTVPAPRLLPTLAILACLAAALSGCTAGGVAAGGGAVAGVAVAQERSAADAITDARIHTQISYLWAKHDLALFRKVNLSVHEGRVLLTGSVINPQTRIDAVRLAWLAEDAGEVINEIQVEDQSGIVDSGRDIWITTQLRSKLLFDANIRSINYSIDTVNGVIYLMGVAQDQAEFDRVTNHARNIRYVRKVISHVRLKNDPRRAAS